MRVRVITPPAAIVTPSAIAGSHSSSDAAVTAMIQAVTEDIDGPGGWLGRALGPQTLEIVAGCFSEIACRGVIRLPYPPLIKVESVKYLDATGVEQTLDAGVYRVNETSLMLLPGESWPATGAYDDAVRVRFKAGYNGTAGATGGDMQTGPVPEKARQAIILSVQDLKRQAVSGQLLRSETTEDIRSVSYVDPDKVRETIERSCNSLLKTLRIHRL